MNNEIICIPCLRLETLKSIGGGGVYFLIRGYKRGCAAGWGHIFTTGLTIMGSFLIELLEWGRTFSHFWDKTVLHIYG